ncbi:MAG TPA: hypothetical protein VFV87_06855 [Pirellulaceae bacterium]|nr:hypothetical protein [Pirellulaceae bacterium]
MTIVHCPRCRDEVTVPAKASPRALVRCPLCLEEYLLSEALAELPPTLLVVGGELEEEPELVGAAAATAEAGGEYGLAGEFGGGVFDSSAPAGAMVTPARPGVKGARPKRKERSALGEMIKIVLGGVIGLSLGLVVIWWLARRDPFNLGPKVAPYAPWIVPAEFRGTQPKADDTVQNQSQGSGSKLNAPSPQTSVDPNQQAAKPKAKGNQLQTLPDVLGSEPETPNPLAPASIDLPSIDPFPAARNSPEPELAPEVPLNPSAGDTKAKSKSKAKAAPSEPPEIDLTGLLPDGDTPISTPADSAAPAPLPPIAGGEATPTATAASLASAVQAANDALGNLEAGKEESKEVRQQLFTDFFLAVADAGRVISHLDPADADVADPLAQLQRLLGELAAQPGKVSAFGHLGRTHLPLRKAGEGFACAGKVIEYRVAGSVFETTLDLGGDVRVLVVSPGNPQDFCEIGDQLLLAGRIVDEPQRNIRGYEGEAERVVMLGDAALVPKAE